MVNVLNDLIRRHRETGILVDTNMLLVYLVGLADPKWVEAVNPNRAYTSGDFEFLSIILGQFKQLIVTPAILAEVSNVSVSRLEAWQIERFFTMLGSLLPSTTFSERFVSVTSVCRTTGFIPFGFADGTVEEIGAAGVPVFTDDANLYQLLASRNVEVFNYNHIRTMAM